MAGALYRTSAGEAEVRRWCAERLGRWPGHDARRIPTAAAGEVHVLTAGTGSPTVVLVPGTNLCTAVGADLGVTLAARCHVVAVDLPGQPGLSDPARPADRIAAYGAMLDELLETLDLDGCVLVGHSMGAAAVLAATPGPRVAAIALLDPAGFVKPAVGAGVLGSFLAWSLRPRAGTSSRLLQRLQSPNHPPSPELVEWFTLVGRTCRSTGAPGPSAPAVVDRWRAVPRSVLVGEHDVFFPPARLAPAVAERLEVGVRTVQGAGHLLPHEDPQRVADEILALG